MSINEKISSLLNELRSEGKNVFPYLYNSKLDNFNPEKDWVFYSGPYWGDEEVMVAIESLISSKWVSAGEAVSKFETGFSKEVGIEQSLMVNSGSSANLVLITALKKHFQWNDGDEIIVSPVGFPTTIAPLIQNNLKPIFVDIDYRDLNFDLDLVEKSIGPKTKGIFLSAVLGNPPDIDRLVKMCKDHGIELIVDGCDSLGTTWKGKELATYGVASTCSFYPAHHISTGEGGMVSSNDHELIKMARRIAWWGRDCYCTGIVNLSPKGACGKRFDKWIPGYDHDVDHKYLFTEVGYNLKPLELQGNIGLVQLKKMDEIHLKRREAKVRIEAILKKHLGEEVLVPQELPDAKTSWFGVPIICKRNKLKQDLVNFLEKNRIQTRNYFAGNILLHPGYNHLDDYKKYPNANRVLDEVFFLGCHPSYNDKVFDRIDQVIGDFARNLNT